MGLELHDVTHRYGGQTALDRVSLHVRRGDCYGFLGHNGAGKTTAMRIALGLTRPTSGRVFIDGFDAAEYPVEARARLGGLIETPGFHAHVSGERNLLLLARLQGMDARVATAETGRVLDLVGLSAAARKPAGAYSQGMRQRLGIAQALLGRPAYVLLDEPTNGLDPEGIEEIRRVLRVLTREEGTTVLLSSHQLHELAGICNRVAILRQGRVLVEAETTALVGAGRIALRAADATKARSVLAARGVAISEENDEFLLEVGDDSDEVLAALVAGGARPASFGLRPESLEDVYLRLTRNPPGTADGVPGGVASDGAAPTRAAPERMAPSGAVRRVAAYDVRRWMSSWSVPGLLVVPGLFAAAAIGLRSIEASRLLARVEAGEIATTTDVTAFEGVATGLRAGLPVLALVAAGIASQSLAGETARGTLRNVVLRPLRRVHAVLGKSLAALLAAGVGYVVVVAATLLAAAWAFDFKDVVEILPNGQPFPIESADNLWQPLRQALWSPLPAVAAVTLVGVFAGTLARGAASALSLALALVIGPDILRSVLRGFDVEWAVPAAHMPSPLGDTSFVATYLDLASGVSNTAYEGGAAVWAAPAVWAGVAVVAAALVLSRRSIR